MRRVMVRALATSLAVLWSIGILWALTLIAATAIRDLRDRRAEPKRVPVSPAVLLDPEPGSVAWCEALYDQEAA